ncbi:hypothetical protein GJ496_010820 [Pomphorhynchus laevis]|nr:hypothetical protein GJ496_010820 [Pomphorhynchus laevis]
MDIVSNDLPIHEVAQSLSSMQLIFIAVVSNIIYGPVQYSSPPRRHITVYFQDYRWFRSSNIGQIPATKFVTDQTGFKLIDRSINGIDIKLGSRYVVGAISDNSKNENNLVIGVFRPADGELTQLCMEMTSVPAGWLRQPGGGWIYPIVHLFKTPNWWLNYTDPNELKCVKTGRPALLCRNENIILTVEQIIPPDAESRNAPYGDGKFKITVSNIDPYNFVTIPALLIDQNTGEISWEDSLIIIDRSSLKSYCPNGAGKRDNLAAFTMYPKSSVCAVVNVLTLKGDKNWHVGGTRLYFGFAIGEMIQENFFYSYYKEHKTMHQTMKGKPTISKC